MTISEDMVERAAKAIRASMLGPDCDLDGDWRNIGSVARGMYEKEARAALTAALQGSVVVSQAEWDNLRAILGRLDDQICATKDILTAAKMASQVTRPPLKTPEAQQ